MRIPLVSNIFNKGDAENYVAIDVGSSSVKAAIFKPPTELSERRILGVGIQTHGLSSMKGGIIQDLDAVIETTNLALEAAYLRAGVQSKQAIFGFGGGTIHARGLRVRTRRREPDTQLTEDEFQMLANHIEEKTLEEAKKEVEEKVDGQVERVGTDFTSYIVDGAYVESPIGVASNELEIAVLHYFIEPEKLRLVNNLADRLDLEIVSLVDTAVYSAVDHKKKDQEFVLIDVGGDVTEVVVVKNGKILKNEVVFIGAQDMTWLIQKDFDVSFDKAEELKMSFAQGHLDQERARNIKRSVEAVADVLIDGIAVGLQSFDLAYVPTQFIITGGGRNVPELRSAMTTYPWNKVLPLQSFPKISVKQGKTPNLESLTRMEI